jgi:hypothetical protein
VEVGVVRDGGEEQLTDELLAVICEKVRTASSDCPWALVGGSDGPPARLRAWLVEEKLTVVKAGELLARQGVVVPERTVQRCALEVLGVGRSARGSTVRVADGAGG